MLYILLFFITRDVGCHRQKVGWNSFDFQLQESFLRPQRIGWIDPWAQRSDPHPIDQLGPASGLKHPPDSPPHRSPRGERQRLRFSIRSLSLSLSPLVCLRPYLSIAVSLSVYLYLYLTRSLCLPLSLCRSLSLFYIKKKKLLTETAARGSRRAVGHWRLPVRDVYI